jgi:hypothetical protein
LTTGKTDVHIETYTDEANRVVVLELDVDGNLTRESKAEIAHLFSNRYRAISLTKADQGIKGLNSPGEFKEPVFTKGAWKIKTHASYNDYITQYLVSPVAFIDFADGGVERTDPDGTKYKDFFYGANPIVSYDTIPFNNLKAPLNAAIAVGTVQAAPAIEAEADVLSQLFADELPSTPISIMTVGVTEGMQTNLANLEKLFNFTPESERNGKSTFEVYEKLKALNVTHIAPGYNPFKTC